MALQIVDSNSRILGSQTTNDAGRNESRNQPAEAVGTHQMEGIMSTAGITHSFSTRVALVMAAIGLMIAVFAALGGNDAFARGRPSMGSYSTSQVQIATSSRSKASTERSSSRDDSRISSFHHRSKERADVTRSGTRSS